MAAPHAKGNNIPIQPITSKLYNWASVIEPTTLEQAHRTASMPFVRPHLALMPDAHLGKGATVGSVIPTDRAIIPAAVGVDIGCGMVAVKTQWTEDQLRERADLPTLRKAIEQTVPLSAGKYNAALTDTAAARIVELERLWETAREAYNDRWADEATGSWWGAHETPDAYAANWRLQLGTLGSGNHFIEIVADENRDVWAFLHSGSRGIGNKIAQHHIKAAREVAERYWIDLPDNDLAYLVEDTPEFDRYIAELRWAQEFARLNRAEMMDRTLAALSEAMGAQHAVLDDYIECSHNYTQQENHRGRNLWISRKGAISARAGQLGLIPGSMGTASYVVRGLGNEMSFNSAPHGAGRNYSRSKARKTFTMNDLQAAMVGIEYHESAEFIDEIPAAYKDIDQVMEDAGDLVEIVHQFHQIVNVKGD